MHKMTTRKFSKENYFN